MCELTRVMYIHYKNWNDRGTFIGRMNFKRKLYLCYYIFLYNVIFKFFVKISTQKLSIVLILQGNHVVTCKAKEDVALRKTIIIIIIIKASSSSSKHQQFQHQSLATCIWFCVSVYYLEYMYTIHTLSRAPSSIQIAFFWYFSILSKHTCMHVSTEQKSRQVQIQSPLFYHEKRKKMDG